ncbi:hypothetical protein F5Y11DRAFT_166692 [Daldinia sp. FL1419]|nr:hypothetical protein F5Y11DRAFT_166692 [Daldinia sp. FL1419]
MLISMTILSLFALSFVILRNLRYGMLSYSVNIATTGDGFGSLMTRSFRPNSKCLLRSSDLITRVLQLARKITTQESKINGSP